MCRSTRKIVAAVPFALVLQVYAAPTVHMPASLEGYVRDDNGNPVQGILVMVSEGSYTTRGAPISQAVIRAETGINIDLSDMEQTHYYNSHYTKTNKQGYFVFKTLTPTKYRFWVSWTTWYRTGFRYGVVQNGRARTRYKFPPADTIVIKGGETTVRSVVLPLATVVTAECSIPHPADAEGARFIDAFGSKAAHGKIKAMRVLGYAYQHGQHGVAVDGTQAACWFRRAAAKGDREAERALRQLGKTTD